MKTMQKAAVAVASTGLVLSGVAVAGVGAADAATACTTQDAAAHAALAREIAAVNHATQTGTRLKKAKKANHKHHTKATKRRLKKARKANRTAAAAVHTTYVAYATAASRAASCHGTAAAPGSSQTGSGSNGSQTPGSGTLTGTGGTGSSNPMAPFLTEINSVLGGLGLSSDAANGLAAQLAGLLGAGATQSQIDAVLGQLSPVLTALQDGGASLPLNAATLTGALGALSGSGLDGSALGDLLTPIVGTLTSNNLNPAELQTVLGGLLSQLGGGSLGTTDPTAIAQGAVDTVKSLVEGLQSGDPALAVGAIETALDGLVSSLTSTLGLGGVLDGLGLGAVLGSL